MNRSWQNNSSGGFVYFNNSPQNNSNKNDTNNFLSFSDSPQSNRFNPSNYSSPVRFNKGHPRNFKQQRAKPYSHHANYYNRSSFSSPNNSYNSPNNSYRKFNNSGQQDTNVNKFVHPSFMEDPWAKLELQFKEKSATRTESSTSTSNNSGDSCS